MIDTRAIRMVEEVYQPRIMSSLVLVVPESRFVMSRAKIEVVRRAVAREMAVRTVSLVSFR